MNTYLRIFGAGPLGVLLTVGSVGLALALRSQYPSGALGLAPSLRYAVLACSALATISGVRWSFQSLPVVQRGRDLCVQGAYRWVRHPLYASFITLGSPGLALFLDHRVFLLWLIALHVIWHLVIPRGASHARAVRRRVPRLCTSHWSFHPTPSLQHRYLTPACSGLASLFRTDEAIVKLGVAKAKVRQERSRGWGRTERKLYSNEIH